MSRLTPPANGARTVIPIDRWPDRDRTVWEAAVRPRDPFEDACRAAAWRPATQALIMRSYGRWLGFLLNRGCLNPNVALADRCNEDLVRSYIARLRSQCLDTTATMYIDGLLKALAVMAPNHDWSWLRRAAAYLRRNMRRRRHKHLKIRSSRELFDFGLRLIEEADATSTLAWKRAVQYRDGLLIALLAARPLRLKNLAALEIDRHLVRTGDHFRLLLSPDETKTRIYVDLPIDGMLADRLEHYLEEYRPILLNANQCQSVWITYDGRAMRPGAIYKAIVTRTHKAFGVAINPHIFRDCAATSLAIDDPAHVRVATTLLGHASLSSTNANYNQATTITAARKHIQTIMALRRGPIERRDPEWRPT